MFTQKWQISRHFFKMSDVHDDDGMHSRWEHDYILDSADEIVTGKLCGGGFTYAVYKKG